MVDTCGSCHVDGSSHCDGDSGANQADVSGAEGRVSARHRVGNARTSIGDCLRVG